MRILRCLTTSLLLSLIAGAAGAARKPAPPPGPCDDFYASVNGEWLAAHPPPTNLDRYSRWDELAGLAEQRRQAMLAGTAGPAPGPASRALDDFVASGLDVASLDASGQAALKPLLDRIDAVRKPGELAPAVAALQAAGVRVLFDLRTERDPDTGRPRASLRADAFGLPEAAFYNDADPALREILGFYRAYLGDLLKFSGVPGKQLAAQSGQALALETDLARLATGAQAEVVDLPALDARYPHLKLAAAVHAWGASPAQVLLRQPDFFAALDKRLAKPDLPAWRAFLRARTLQSLAPTLGQDYRRAYVGLVDEKIARRLPSTQAQRVAELVENEASELFNAAFAERALDAAARAQAQALGAAVRTAFLHAIDRASWLSADGKLAARRQVEATQFAIGQPPEPLDLGSLAFDRRQYASNVLTLRRWLKARDLARLAAPNWPAPVSQARPLVGFEAARNRLVVTAAALQAPVFSGRGDAADYGALGALIAQQASLALAHPAGADGDAWRTRTAPWIAQLVAAGADGERVRTLSVADLSGLELAWDALQAKGPVDAAQARAFFSAWASLWVRQERRGANSDDVAYAAPHLRVNAVVAQLPAFATSFACKRKQAMNLPSKQQVALWR